jgi:hypothetical protein
VRAHCQRNEQRFATSNRIEEAGPTLHEELTYREGGWGKWNCGGDQLGTVHTRFDEIAKSVRRAWADGHAGSGPLKQAGAVAFIESITKVN